MMRYTFFIGVFLPLVLCAAQKPCMISKHFVDTAKPMGENIKNILALSAASPFFNSQLGYFGSLLEPYSSHDKFENLCTIEFSAVERYRRGCLLIFHSGIKDIIDRDICKNFLLSKFVCANDTQAVHLLLQNGINPEEKIDISCLRVPALFRSKTVEMATVFANYKADFTIKTDLSATSSGHLIPHMPNVLWYAVEHFDIENLDALIRFYISKGVDPTLTKMGKSLLHLVAEKFYFRIIIGQYGDNSYADRPIVCIINTARTILNAIRGHINMIYGPIGSLTPLGILTKKLLLRKKDSLPLNPWTEKSVLSLIDLFSSYGAKTAEGLEGSKDLWLKLKTMQGECSLSDDIIRHCMYLEHEYERNKLLDTLRTPIEENK